ncbi:MAG: dihydrofolate reductase family protein [Gaiellales bacterium]
MRKLKLAMYVALDGVVADPAWTAPYWNDELAAMQNEYLMSSDALVLGRVTYEGFAASWPGMEESTGAFGRKMNSMPKFVATRTLDQLEWNAAPIRGDLAAEVGKLKQAPGDDLLIYGSGNIVDQLTDAGLIDEYRLMVYPVVVGSGSRLFATSGQADLRLIDSMATGAGVMVLSYARAG